MATPGEATGVTVVEDRAYVTDSMSGIQMINVSSPRNPQIIGSISTQNQANDLTVVGDYAYFSDDNGLTIKSIPVQIDPKTVTETAIRLTLPSPVMAGHYTLRVFNDTENDELNDTENRELKGAVSFITNDNDNARMLSSKAIIVAGAGPNAPGEIWDAIKASADRAYNALIHKGFFTTTLNILPMMAQMNIGMNRQTKRI